MLAEAGAHHADPEVQVGSRDQRGEGAQSRLLHAAQQARDGGAHHQRQREQEPVQQLRPRAAHLADDHLALWEQKAPGEKRWASPEGLRRRTSIFSALWFGRGGTGLRFRMGLVAGASWGPGGHRYNLKYTLFWRQCFDTLEWKHVFTKGEFVCHLMFSQRLLKL